MKSAPIHRVIGQLLAIAILVQLTSCQTEPAPSKMTIEYPMTKKVDSADTYFGTVVEDPYRWLEDEDAEERAAWVDAQNKVTYAYLEQLGDREAIRSRLEQIWDFERISVPFKEGEKYFFRKNDGIQNQSIVFSQEGLDGDMQLVLDPNLLSDDGTVALGGFSVSKDGKYGAYSISSAGSDWQEIKVIDLSTGTTLDDHIKWVKFSGMSWLEDGFFYSRYPAPDETQAYSQANQFHKVYYHKVGTPTEDDQLIFDDPEHPLRNFGAWTTSDEEIILLSSSASTSGGTLHFKKASANSDDEFVAIDSTFDHEYSVVHHENGTLLIHTNNEAPNNRLVAVSTDATQQENWKTILPEREEVLQSVSVCNGKLVAKYLKDVVNYLEIFTLEGISEGRIELPGEGIVGSFSSSHEEPLAFYSFVNYTTPSTVYSFNIEDLTSTIFHRPDIDFKSDDYITNRVFYPSKDGTEIPLFITHKKGITLDGERPVFLYGYGGFNISVSPGFRIDRTVFLENGGVYAVANLRGGSEYGEEWHQAGMNLTKQNVFDDFIAAAEYLIKENYTNPGKLSIHGRSNGGLLVGAVMTQRPDLFKVALPKVGVLDMLRYHKFTIGWAWAKDYGTSDNEEEFKNLHSFSPVHNVKEVNYPATLVITGDHDDRVVPAHSFKFISALQDKGTGDLPMLIRIDTDGGHGSGKPVSMQISEFADTWAFVFHHLGMKMETSAELEGS